MRRMLLHRTDDGLPAYFYCTECAWLHTETRFQSECEPRVTYHHEVAELAFRKHECEDYRGSATSASQTKVGAA